MDELLQRIIRNSKGRQQLFTPTTLLEELAGYRNQEVADLFYRVYTSLHKCSECKRYYENFEIILGHDDICHSCDIAKQQEDY